MEKTETQPSWQFFFFFFFKHADILLFTSMLSVYKGIFVWRLPDYTCFFNWTQHLDFILFHELNPSWYLLLLSSLQCLYYTPSPNTHTGLREAVKQFSFSQSFQKWHKLITHSRYFFWSANTCPSCGCCVFTPS